MDNKQTVLSLQVQCSRVISLNTEQLCDTVLTELNQPCLSLIVDQLSMYDLLRLENILSKRGINVKTALFRLQRLLFMNNETYPIKSTTCPHLLDLFPCDGWDWGLSRLLYRRAVVQLMEEYSKGSSQPLSHLVESHSYLLDLFCPVNTSKRETIKQRVMASENMVEKLAEMAARFILFITVDQRHCQFLLDKKYEALFDSFCDSLLVISVILKSSPILPCLLKVLKQRAKKLERICINVIRSHDLQYFDSILSICSGVTGFYTTVEGQRCKKHLMSIISTGHDETSAAEQVRMEDDIEADVTEVKSDFDLMDDAVLFGTSCPSSAFDSNAGMTKADFKFTNLVDKDLYVPVLDHHLQSWLSLRELHLGVSELHPKIVQGLCCLLRRPHFKSFTLSSADYNHVIMEEILFAVASRGCNPLDKLMFVSLHEKVTDLTELIAQDRIRDKSSEEVDLIVKSQESRKIAELQEFQGTRFLEVYLCTLGLRTECLLLGYVSSDVTLTKLCYSNSISRLFVQHHLSHINTKSRQMSTLILEDWLVMNTSSFMELSAMLACSATTLECLNLKGCLHADQMDNIEGILHLISNCKNLHSLDLSENHLGENVIQYINQIIKNTSVKELALRRNGISLDGIIGLLNAISRPRSDMLEILDLRGNKFLDCHRKQYCQLISGAVKFLLVDNTSSPVDDS